MKNQTQKPWLNRLRMVLGAAALSVLAGCGGSGGASNPDSATSANPVPPVSKNTAPSSVRLVEVSSTTAGAINVSWLPASDDTTPAGAIKYQIHASNDASFSPSASTLKFEGVGVTSANITTGLAAGSLYSVRLVATDANGASTASDGMAVTIAKPAVVESVAPVVTAPINTTTPTSTTSNIAANAINVPGVSVQTLPTHQVSTVTTNTVALQAGVTAPAIGTFISSTDANGGLGYLRKVTGVTQSGGVSTLQTASAAVTDVVQNFQISSSFRMGAVPAEVASQAVQSGIAVVNKTPDGSAQNTYSWSDSKLRYVAGTGVTSKQLGLYFNASNNATQQGSWGKILGNNRITIAEGSDASEAATSALTVVVTDRTIPWNSRTAVGICNVKLGAVWGTGSDSQPKLVGAAADYNRDFAVTQSVQGGKIAGNQKVYFWAKAGAASDKPYKVIATAYLDDIGDGCSDGIANTWREKIDFELEIFVTTDTAPTQEPAEKVFTGSAGFKVKNNIVTTFNPTVVFDKNITNSSLKYARMGVQASPRIEQTLTIDATAQGSMDKTMEIIQPRKFFKVYMAGSVPIVVSGVLRMDMRIKGDVSGELHATEKLNIGFDDVSFGVEYKNGQFVPYQTVKPVYQLRLGGNGKAEANLEIHVLPSLELTGYEVLTGKAVLDPYMNAGAGVEGHVQMDIDAVDLITAQTGAPTASDADYRLTKTRLGAGVNAYLYADFHIWDTTLKTWPETAKKDDYETFKKVELVADTTIMDLPVLKAFLPEGNGTTHPQDSCAIKIRGTATNVPNPLHATFPFMNDSYIKWVRWTSPRIVQQLGIPSSSYSFIPDPNGEEGVFWARMTKPGTYTVRVGGYSDWGTWARQYTEITVDATDANSNGIPDWWEKRYGLTGTGAEIANGDTNGDGRTNLQEWQQCKNPVQKGTPPITATLNANPKNVTVMEKVWLWVTDAVQAIKSVLWDLGDGTTKTTTVGDDRGTTSFDKTYTTSGNKTVTATYLDASGKPLGAASATIAVASAPVAPASTPVALITAASADSGSKVGAIANGGSTDDTTPALSGTVTNFDASTQSVNIYDGNTRLDPAATVDSTLHLGSTLATVAAQTWKFPITTPLALRAHSFTVRVEKRLDGTPVGATSPAYTITVTTAPPTCAPTETLASNGKCVTATPTCIPPLVLNVATNQCVTSSCDTSQIGSDGTCSTPGGIMLGGYNFNVQENKMYPGLYPYNNTIVTVRGRSLPQTAVVDVAGLECNIEAPTTAGSFGQIGSFSITKNTASGKVTYPDSNGYANGFASVCRGVQMEHGKRYIATIKTAPESMNGKILGSFELVVN
ncbi:MAG: hypothetical protein RIR79_2085 [Pseudomonadota bacterium]